MSVGERLTQDVEGMGKLFVNNSSTGDSSVSFQA